MPPFVSSFCPRNFVPSPLQDQDMLNHGVLFHGSINDDLVSDSLASTFSFIRCDNNTTFIILNAIAERFGREPCKNDRMNSSPIRAQARKVATACQVIRRYTEMVLPFWTPRNLRTLATLETSRKSSPKLISRPSPGSSAS
jgi:hypothetical protein